MTHFALTRKTANAQEIARLFMSTVFRLHGMPNTIISDRDNRFIASFWRTVTTCLGTKLKFSTSFHPQTDGQAERANRTLEEMLRAFVHPRQDDWATYLPMVEFAINNAVSAATGYSPFFLNYGRELKTPLDRLAPSTAVPEAQEYLQQLKMAREDAIRLMQEAQARMVRQEDVHRRPAPAYKKGDKVMLSTANLKLPETLSSKLQHRFIGPFTVTEVMSPVTFKLDIPAAYGSRLHRVFHSSLLAPYITDTEHPEHVPPEPPGPVFEEDDQYLVEALLKHKGKGKNRRYRVRWLGYNQSHDSWVLADNIEPSLITEYHARMERLRKSRTKKRKEKT